MNLSSPLPPTNPAAEPPTDAAAETMPPASPPAAPPAAPPASPAISHTAPHAAPLPPLRLGVGHLLLWMTLSGAVLCVYRLLNDPQDFSARDWEFSNAFQMVMSIAYSLLLTGVLVLVARRLRGDRRFPKHAGHWLVVMGVIAMLIDCGSLATVKALAFVQGVHWFHYWYAYQATSWGLGAFFAAAFVLLPAEPRWRTAFWALALLCMQNSLLHMGANSGWFGVDYNYWQPRLMLVATFLGMSLMVIAAWRDRAKQTPRDWMHWGGVTAWLAMGGMQIAVGVWNTWLMR